MFIHETLSGDPLVSYQLPAVNVNGEAINGLLNRITQQVVTRHSFLIQQSFMHLLMCRHPCHLLR